MISFSMKRFRDISLALLLSGVLSWCAEAQTQTGNPSNLDTPGASARLLEEVRQQMLQGRAQLDANQSTAVATLREAALKALNSLNTFIGPQVLKALPEEFPTTGFLAAATRQAAEAHLWWGRAADHFGRRDESLAAFARAVRLAGKLRGGSNETARDALLELGGALRDGLPLLAPDDALEIIAAEGHGGLWTPRRFTVDYSNMSLKLVAAGQSTLSPDAHAGKHEFLVTSGQLYPPVPTSAANPAEAKTRIAPIYSRVDPDSLPQVLRLDRVTLGYQRETSGSSKGLWRQVVQVFYPSQYRAKNRRDDRHRAEALCAQFLKLQALYKRGLGLENPWVGDGVTTLWLSEVSSWWPRDDDDPRVRAAIGAQMPRINVPIKGQTIPTEVQTPPTQIAWNAAGQTDSAPGEMIFFRMTEPREEAEWLRQLMHEYGHVVLPPIAGFKPPLEPYGNGVVGETLGMLWAAAQPKEWDLPAQFEAKAAGEAALSAAFLDHVQRHALASLKFWLATGPSSPLRRDGTAEGLLYLQGLTTYIERVYGAPILGRASTPLVAKAVSATNPLARLHTLTTDSLAGAFPGALRDSFGSSVSGAEVRLVIGEQANARVLPVWLGGALELPSQSAADLVARAPVKIKTGERLSGWLFVPPTAGSLRIEWQSTSRAGNLLQVEGSKSSPVAPVQVGASGGAIFDFRTRANWQRISLVAASDVTIVACQFEQ